MTLAWGQWERQVALRLWWGVSLDLKDQCIQKVFQLARWIWVLSSTKDPTWSIVCFKFLSVSFSHLVPLTTRLGQTANIHLLG